MEVKKNRQKAIAKGLNQLRPPSNISRPGLFSDAKAVKALEKNIDIASKNVRRLRQRLLKALESPTTRDPVYKAFQRVFHRKSDLVLTRDNPVRRIIKRRAFRRYILGCPPRKDSDTSMGDAVNWEWMIECAIQKRAELVIVSRDADYGLLVEKRAFLNDHLRHEFSERVSGKRKVHLYTLLSDALQDHFKVTVTQQEKKEEEQIAETRTRQSEDQHSGGPSPNRPLLSELFRHYVDEPPGPSRLDEVFRQMPSQQFEETLRKLTTPSPELQKLQETWRKLTTPSPELQKFQETWRKLTTPSPELQEALRKMQKAVDEINSMAVKFANSKGRPGTDGSPADDKDE
jgi:hypothetical protein